MSAKTVFKMFEDIANRLRVYLLANLDMSPEEKDSLEFLHDAPGVFIYDFVEKNIAPRAASFVKGRDSMKDKTKFTTTQTRQALSNFLPPKTLLRVIRAPGNVRAKILDYLSWFVTAVGDDDE